MFYMQNSKKLRCSNSTSCRRKNSYECQCSQSLLQLFLLLLFFFLPSERLLNAVSVVDIHPVHVIPLLNDILWGLLLEFVCWWSEPPHSSPKLFQSNCSKNNEQIPSRNEQGGGWGRGWNKVGGIGVVGSTSSGLQIYYSTSEMFFDIVREAFVTLI